MGQAIITNENIHEYLDSIKPHLGFSRIIDIQEYNDYSNANFLYKLIFTKDDQKYTAFLKQALPYGKRNRDFTSDSKRMLGEVSFIQFLTKLWGQEFLPEILHFDDQNYILILRDISLGKSLLIEEFKKNQVHPELGSKFGELFGRLHSSTYKTEKDFCQSQSWHDQMQFYIKEYTTHGISKYVDVSELEKFFNELDNLPHSTIWNDPVYRNIFIGPKGEISLIDFDFVINYDAAIDNGFFLSHWLWMALKGDARLNSDCIKFIEDYVENYKKQWSGKLEEKEFDQLMDRSFRFAGIYLVSRTDGKSGSYFKDFPEWEVKIRQKGIDLFQKGSNERSVSQIISR